MLGDTFLNMRGESFSFGQFEEQQAFEKSRKFLRQLEICFAENPAHHQKIIKVLQSCADCLPQEIAEVIRHTLKNPENAISWPTSLFLYAVL